jgi:hypothetical protein
MCLSTRPTAKWHIGFLTLGSLSFIRCFGQKNYIFRWIFSHIIYLSFFFATLVSSAWIIIFCWLGISSCRNNKNQLLPFQIEFQKIVVHVGLIWILKDSFCDMCWDKNIGIIGYGLGKKVGLYFTTWTKCIVLIQSVKKTLCGHYKMSRFTNYKMVIL